MNRKQRARSRLDTQVYAERQRERNRVQLSLWTAAENREAFRWLQEERFENSADATMTYLLGLAREHLSEPNHAGKQRRRALPTKA